MTKHIFVTGGVVSGLGKGITAASLGRLLKCRGLKVAAQKLDPYMENLNLLVAHFWMKNTNAVNTMAMTEMAAAKLWSVPFSPRYWL